LKKFDLVIRGGQIVTHESVIQTDLAIQGERIAALGDNLSGIENIEAEGLLVIPGGVDPHVHLQMPTATTVTSDDWRTGSLAAACGGTTSIIDFVEPLPGQTMQEALNQRKAEANGASLIDYGLHMTIADVSESTLSQIPGMLKEGVTSFKVYTTYTGLKLNYQELSLAMQEIAAWGGLCMVHAEDDGMIQEATKQLVEKGKITPQWFPFSRPAGAELEAVQRCLKIAKETNVMMYVVHISTSQAIEAINEARKAQVCVMGETCPQYLLLDQKRMIKADPIDAAGLVCSPPLRDPSEKGFILDAIQDGKIHSIGSDHCSFRLYPQKEIGIEDFRIVPGGLPGIELRYPLLFTYGVQENRISLQDWVNLCSTQPAKIFGLYPKKGSLEVGADADIVLFNPKKKVVVSRDMLHENVDYSPYQGMELSGYPEMTIIKGKTIVANGKRMPTQHQGSFLTCNLPKFL
jgi:dihydropyrimidinase